MSDVPVLDSGPFTLTLILVRHGETTWNADNRFQGRQDIPLSDVGRAQARALGDRFLRAHQQGYPPVWCLTGAPTHVFTSDLSRARETAEIVSAAFPDLAPLELLPLLQERSYGSWEGLTVPEIRDRFGTATQAEDAEDYNAVFQRNRQARDHIWERMREAGDDNASAIALVVGHGGTMRMMLALALGMGVEAWNRIRLDNTGVSAVTFHGTSPDTSTGRVLCINDTAHFDAVKQSGNSFPHDRPRLVSL